MSQRKAQLDPLAVISIIACCFIWGLNQVAAKATLPEIPPLWQACVRSLGGALLVWAWSRLRRIPLFEPDGTAPGGALAGLLFAAEFACIFIGLQFTTASRMVVFLYLAPFVVALGMPFIARSERLSWPQLTGLAIAFAAVAGAFAEGFTQPAAGARQWIGDALGVVAAVLWGATTLVVRATRLTSASAEKTLLYQLAISGVMLGAAAWATNAPVPTSLSTLAWGSLAFQILVVTFFSFLVWFWLVRHYPATRLSSFTLLTPMFGLVLGALLLREPITARLGLALVGVSVGIWLVNRPKPGAATGRH
ncbi:MAG TPA: DMT family transporter [Caldimonas sp.]|nr:DMT family transporter [Caldimonas sp.]